MTLQHLMATARKTPTMPDDMDPDEASQRTFLYGIDATMPRGMWDDWPFRSPYSLIAERGIAYKADALTDEEMGYVLMVAGMIEREVPYLPKMCYRAGQLTSTLDPTGRIKYVEGYCFTPIPVLHGWNEIDGKIIDLTLRRRGYPLSPRARFSDRNIGETGPFGYIGIPFPTDYVAQALEENDYYDTLLNDYNRQYPMLREMLWQYGERTSA